MAWSDSPIEKDYNLNNLASLLSQGLLGSMSRYTHFQIIEWCQQFVSHYNLAPDDDFPIDPEAAVIVADDAVVQWELYLASQYRLEDLKKFSLSDVVLPKHYFERWLDRMLQLAAVDSSAAH